MKLILDKFDQLPRGISEKQVNAIHAGREVCQILVDNMYNLPY